jgi:hypothetical protein
MKFPVMTLNGRGDVWVARDVEQLTTCTVSALKRRHFDSLEIVDATGASWRVQSVTKVANVGPLFGFRLPFFSRLIRVALDLEQGPLLDLASLKQRVCDTLDRDVDFWDSGEGLKRLKARIRTQQAISSLMDLFWFYYHRT